eukprot:16721_1
MSIREYWDKLTKSYSRNNDETVPKDQDVVLLPVANNPNTRNRLGNYRLGAILGYGSFSKVRTGIHEPTQTRVVIKIFNQKKLHSMEMESKIEAEIAILASLNHPHVIRLYDVIQTSSHKFVVMEHLGIELFDYIVSTGRLPEPEARKYFQQMICAMEYCHSKGIVHRDLKPENILLDHNNNLRICDFGLSNKMKDGYFLRTSCGSPNYAAPEVICDELYEGPEVDVWSCGVILYALLCGSLPFDDESAVNLLNKIRSGIYKIPQYVPKRASHLIHRMLTVHPLKRITIHQIKQCRWFKQDLPKYLQSPMNTTEMIDSNVVTQLLEHLDIDLFEVEQALKKGTELLCKNINKYNNPHLARHRHVAVCYRLLNDQLHRNELPTETNQSTSSSNSTIEYERNLYCDPYYKMKCYHHYNTMQWVIGFIKRQTSPQPQIIMQHLLESLRQIEMEWRWISPYCIVTRKMKLLFCNEEHTLKIQIQLYRTYIQTKIDPEMVKAVKEGVHKIIESLPHMNWIGIYKSISNDILQYAYDESDVSGTNYVLDLHKISGGSLPFMHLCAHLMKAMEKQRPAQFSPH